MPHNPYIILYQEKRWNRDARVARWTALCFPGILVWIPEK